MASTPAFAGCAGSASGCAFLHPAKSSSAAVAATAGRIDRMGLSHGTRSVAAQRIQIIQQRRISVPIAELQVVPHVRRLIQVMRAVPACKSLRHLERLPSLHHIADDLIARRRHCEPAGVHLKARPLLLALVPIENPQRKRNARAERVVDAAALVLARNRRITRP